MGDVERPQVRERNSELHSSHHNWKRIYGRSSTIGCQVILAEKDWARWLGEEPVTNEELLAMLRPCPDADLKIRPVDKRVGNVRNKGPELALAL